MKYQIDKNTITIFGKEEFNPKHILECGQIFSYTKSADGYTVFSGDKMAKVIETDDCIKIVTSDVPYFENFFDLKTNYTKIKHNIEVNYPYLKKALSYGGGIRILKQDIFETIISFIVSANNNIKRIQKILFAIREKFGKKMDGYTSFPTPKELLAATVEDFRSMGAGYRDKYLYTVVRQIIKMDVNKLKNLSTPNLTKSLRALAGVGPKVADCIMLFAFGRMDVFPVDTWIEKVYCQYFGEEHDRNKIRNNLLKTFGENSGYAQQYLFYLQRENS